MKRFMRVILRIVVAAAVVAAVVYVIQSVLSDSVVTEIVKTGTLEDVIPAQGLLIKNETVYAPDADGAFEPQVREGVKVAKGMRLGSVYTGQVDPALKKEWNHINKSIETLKSSAVQSQVLSNDMAKLDSDIAGKIATLIDNAESHKMAKVTELKTSVSYLANHKAKLRGEEVAEMESLEELTARRQEVESSLGAVRSDIYAKNAGIFSSYLDGLEGEITPARITELKPSDLKKYQAVRTKTDTEGKQGIPVCKVISNFEYYVAIPIETKLASNLKSGDSLQLRFPELTTQAVAASVKHMSDDENGQVAVVASTTENVPDIFSKRKVTVELVKRQYKGLRVPVSAVRVQNDTKGVYVIRESVMRFIPVDILYNNNESAIVKEDTEEKDALKLYDELVLRADQYEDGKLVR